MLQTLLPFISPILLAFGFWRFFVKPDSFWFLAFLSILLIILTIKILAKKHFLHFFRLWINLSIVYLAQILFLIVVNLATWRYILTVFYVLLWFAIFWLIAKYFKSLKDINDLDYLAFTRFLYYLSFWQLACTFYYLIVFINFSPWLSLLLFLVLALFFAKEIFLLNEKIVSGFIVLLLFTLAQVFLALFLMSISFYVAGTIAALWFFFLLEWSLASFKSFMQWLVIFLVASAALLISSLSF